MRSGKVLNRNVLKGVGIAVINIGATPTKNIQKSFRDMSNRAYDINGWVLDHPYEVERRLAVYERLGEKPAVLRRVDALPEEEGTLAARVSDTPNDHIFYGNRSRGVYLALDDRTFAELGQPAQLQVEASGVYAPAISVSPRPKQGEPIYLHAGLIHWD